MGAVAVVSVIALFLRDHIEITNIAMLYLVAVVWVSARTGRGPAVAASVVGVGLFDFICVPPYFTFAVSDTEYLLTFAVMLIVALTITELTAGMRYQARIAAHRERRAAALAAMSRELSGALTAQQIAEIAVQHVRGVFEAPSTLLLPDRAEALHIAPADQANALPNVDLSVARGYTIAGSRRGSAPTRWRVRRSTTSRCARRCAIAACSRWRRATNG